MEPKPPRGPADVAAIAFAALTAFGILLPFWVFDFGDYFRGDFPFVEADSGTLAFLLSVGAAGFAAARVRIGAVLALAAVVFFVWRELSQVELGEGITLGVGVYVIILGLVGALGALVVGWVRPGLGVREPAAWVPPEVADESDLYRGRIQVDPDDPFRVVR